MDMHCYLFSYGTLQKEKVQIEIFGRLLTGKVDYLVGYSEEIIEITDNDVLLKSEQKLHPILKYTGDLHDLIKGVLYELTEEELLKADKYEIEAYKRVIVNLKSGKTGQVYIQK